MREVHATATVKGEARADRRRLRARGTAPTAVRHPVVTASPARGSTARVDGSVSNGRNERPAPVMNPRSGWKRRTTSTCTASQTSVASPSVTPADHVHASRGHPVEHRERPNPNGTDGTSPATGSRRTRWAVSTRAATRCRRRSGSGRATTPRARAEDVRFDLRGAGLPRRASSRVPPKTASARRTDRPAARRNAVERRGVRSFPGALTGSTSLSNSTNSRLFQALAGRVSWTRRRRPARRSGPPSARPEKTAAFSSAPGCGTA